MGSKLKLNRTVISPCNKYRYLLVRNWDKTKPKVLFIGLNPSTATSSVNDPTVLKLKAWCKHFGYGGYKLINIYAYRATNKRMLKLVPDPVGPENDKYFEAFKNHPDVMFMWGSSEFVDNDRVKSIAEMFGNARCFGHSIGGQPKHPLFLSTLTRPIKFWKKPGI